MTVLDRAAEYHRLSMYHRHSMSGGGLDWSNKPDAFKTYPDAPSVPLPRELVLPKADAAEAMLGGLKRRPETLNLGALANLLFMSYGFTAQMDYGHEVFQYRSAPSAGALYPTEVYLAAAGIDGLEDGLYHYSIADFTLKHLRSGTPPAGLPAPALVMTGLFFRSAWKYKDRAFRYCLMDTGHVAENILLAAPCLGLDAELELNFDDALVNRLLGLDPAKEAALCVLKLGPAAEGLPGAAAAMSDSVPPAAGPAAKEETAFELIVEAVRLTSAPIQGNPPEPADGPEAGGMRLPETAAEAADGPTLVQVLQRRRSRRNFKPQTIGQSELARVLDLIVMEDTGRIVDLGVVTNEVKDLLDGFYRVSPDGRLSFQRGGFLGPALAEAALSQDWLGRANAVLVVSADFDALEAAVGPRALRLAYFSAGRIGQRAYLAAEASDWGCCGVGAFFDAEAAGLLALPENTAPIYFLPLGPVKKRTHGGRPTPG